MQGAVGHAHVVLGLQVHPEARLHAEEQAQPQGRIGGDGALAVDQVADAAGRHVDVCRQLARGDAHGFHEVFQQDFAGVDFVQQFEFGHVVLLVVVHDFDLVGAVGVPHKADAPLVIDADAVLPFAVALQGFKLVVWRDSQAI